MTDRNTLKPIPNYQRCPGLYGHNSWCVLGCAPGAKIDYRDWRASDAGVLITCNGGIEIVSHPDFYWCHDTKALRWWYGKAAQAHSLHTLVLTSAVAADEVPPVREIAGVVFDLPGQFTKRWLPGLLCNPICSGAICAQLAVLHGARRITLIGMTGYRSTAQNPVVDYDDGRLGGGEGAMAYYGPFMVSLIEQTPQIEWISYGTPLWLPDYTLHNLSIKETHDGEAE